MLTMGTDGVDGQRVLVTVSELARQKGVSKLAISKRIAALEARNAIKTFAGERNARLVSLAEYDRAVGETSELAHAQTPRKPLRSDSAPVDPDEIVYAREQAREKAYAADLKKIDLDKALGLLVPVEQIAEAAGRMAERLVRQLDQLVSRADDVAAAVAKDGVAGARAVLKTLARETREAMARDLEHLADHQGSLAKETDTDT